MAVGQKAEMTDALEAGRQNMQQEAADKLLDGDGHYFGLPLIGTAVIFPVERQLAVVEGNQALIGDGDAMGIAAEILDHLLGAAEGRFGIDYPFGLP